MHCDAHPILLIHPLMTLRSWLCLSCHLLLALCVCLAVSAALRRLRQVQSLPSSARCVARLGESPIVEVMTPAMDGDEVMVYDCQLAPDSAASHLKRHMRHKQVNQAQDADYHCPRRCTFDLVHFCASYMVVLRPNHSGPTLSFSSCCFADKNLPGQNTYLVVHLSIWSNDVLTLLVRLFQESVLVTETSKTQKTVFKSLKRHKDCSERAYASSVFSEQILYIYMEGCKVLYNIQVVI